MYGEYTRQEKRTSEGLGMACVSTIDKRYFDEGMLYEEFILRVVAEDPTSSD